MKLFLFIIIILSVLGILEYKAVVPASSFGVLLALDTIANFIKSLDIHTYYLILPDITITVQGLLSIFLVLFIVGYISDRFRTLDLKVKSLNKEINKLNANKEETKISEPESNNEMQQIASDIKGFLETLAKSVTANPSMPIRSKKIRRVSAESVHEEMDQDNNIPDEIIVNEKITENNENEPQEINQETSVVSDDNLSSIDLARALIQSNEKDKAKEVLLDIIKNGSANDAHEARVLNLQIS
jgi:FimV-like protein